MPVDTAIVPVAGLGTRLLPVTAGIPKELLPLGRKPTLHHIAEELGRVGIRRIVLVSSLAKQNIARYFQLNQSLEDSLRAQNRQEALASLWSQSSFMGIDVDVVIQHQQRGLGDAVLCGQPGSPEPVIVALGDCVIGANGGSNILERMLNVFDSKSAEIVIAFEEVATDNVCNYGIAAPKQGQATEAVFELEGLAEKPLLSDAPSNLAIAARYILGPEIFKELKFQRPGLNGEIQLTDALQSLIKSGIRAYGVRLEPDEKRYDVGNFNSYTEAFVEFALADPELRQIVIKAVSEHSSHL